MPDETLSIFEEQAAKLPSSVVTFLASAGWAIRLKALTFPFGLTPDQTRDFNTEAVLVLAGIVHPDAFKDTIVQHTGIPEATATTPVQDFEKNILATIRPALLEFFAKERADAEAQGGLPEDEEVVVPATKPASVSIAPANLPTEEVPAPLIPPLVAKVTPPKIVAPEVILMHPFEEKMQGIPAVSTPAPTITPMPSTFTPQAPLVPPIIPIVPQSPAPVVPQVPQSIPAFIPAPNGAPRGTLTHDPYREPVE